MRLKKQLEPVWAIGLMSGTSLDGIDVALLKTDGHTIFQRGPWLSEPFDDQARHDIREAVYLRGDIPKVENMLTRRHAEAVQKLLRASGFSAKDVNVIGFHGQTLVHRPAEGITWQIGNGFLLAEMTGINVVGDFRRHDVAAGGQGAPLVPLYHAALAQGLDLPVVVLNLGGIGNVTWVGRSEARGDDIMSMDILSFDTGPGNALINEWALSHTGRPMDENGVMASKGTVQQALVDQLLSDPFFAQVPPKSLDRNYFTDSAIRHLSAEDGAATLTAFTAQSMKMALKNFPVPAKKWFVSGGGRHNPAIMRQLREHLGDEVFPVEALGWEGDAIEAQAFAFLAVRSLAGLPLSLPTTTGANRPVTGGAFYPA